MPKAVRKKIWSGFVVQKARRLMAAGVTINVAAKSIGTSPEKLMDKMLEHKIAAVKPLDIAKLEAHKLYPVAKAQEAARLQEMGRIRQQRHREQEASQEPPPENTGKRETASQPHFSRPQDRLEHVLGTRYGHRGEKYYLDGRQANFFDCIREANRTLKANGDEQIPIPACMV